MKSLYPEISPFHTFFLETDSIHRVYVEQSGNPAGMPVVFLHGGPCSGAKPDHRRFFDPALYHIILLDQRGCGRSTPFGELSANTTQGLLDDLERIRLCLRVEQWLLFGGSWGATLALLYAQRYPQRVSAMILRGTFLARKVDMEWFLENGVNHIYPQRWHDMLQAIGAESPETVLTRLTEAVFGDDVAAAERAVMHWQLWGSQVALGNDFADSNQAIETESILQVRMELHYARNHYFIEEDQILQNCGVLQSIPTAIIHGQKDLTCPLEAGWTLHRALPQARYVVLPNAGHVARGEEMVDALVAATDYFADYLA
jgi:proline iminopeptidase